MNFATGELVTVGLSTGCPPRAYKRHMSQTLKSYFDAERGRQSRLAEDLGVSRSYLSDVANGHKPGSLELLRRIADLTGLDLSDLAGRPPGMAEGDARPYLPGPKANKMRDVAGMLFPGLRNVSYYTATMDQPGFGILSGDLLVLETSFAADRVEPGKLVLARGEGQNSAGQTLVGRLAPPWLIDGNGRISGEVGMTVGLIGLVQVVLRSADPSAF